jgi:hypothetical protein
MAWQGGPVIGWVLFADMAKVPVWKGMCPVDPLGMDWGGGCERCLGSETRKSAAYVPMDAPDTRRTHAAEGCCWR